MRGRIEGFRQLFAFEKDATVDGLRNLVAFEKGAEQRARDDLRERLVELYGVDDACRMAPSLMGETQSAGGSARAEAVREQNDALVLATLVNATAGWRKIKHGELANRPAHQWNAWLVRRTGLNRNAVAASLKRLAIAGRLPAPYADHFR